MKKAKMKTKKSTIKKTRKPAGQIAEGLRGTPGICKFRLDQLQPADYNPRMIDNEAMEGLKNFLSNFGCVEPIVVNTRDRKNIIICCNQK